MGNSIFGIGIGALGTAQAGLVTTGHNISNVNTAGYHRQEIVQSTNIPQYTGIGFLGQGVRVDTVKRLYDQMLENQVMSAQTQSSQLETYYAQIKQIDNMLADPSAGVSPALQDFFNGVHDVAANPAAIPSRQAMLSNAQTMVSRFQSINQRFTEIRDGVNSEIGSSVGVINSYARQIANLNQQINVAQGAAAKQQPANDLLDQRDQLIGELNKIIRVSTVKQDDGSLNIFIGNGQSLVLGAQAFTMGSAPSLEDPERMDVGISYGGSTILLPSGSLQGGTLGGLLAFRSETLDPAQNALGRMAVGLAQTFNDQHRLGMDLQGQMGGYFFNVAGPTGVSGQNAVPYAKVVANTKNAATSGNPTVTLSNVANVTTSDYRLSYDGTNYWQQRRSDQFVCQADCQSQPAD
ncbi:MAG: flagellar hook-associated protein FlgK [Gammaproteobacteria bacterium]|nr:flagellar hook-associated protein FlgK [Gammaproteobacteria bacterium]